VNWCYVEVGNVRQPETFVPSVLACIERAMLANITHFSMKQLQNVTHVLTGSFQ